MKRLGPERRIFISSMAIYDEVPGQSFQAALRPYREAADVIEASDLDYTIRSSSRSTGGRGFVPCGTPLHGAR